jgi:RalA-binding protein 1
VGIVFAPTLNIPAPLISMFLTDYADIFGQPLEESQSPIREVIVTAPAESPDSIRSPRHQMFSDLPTPAYNQQSFQAPAQFPMLGASNAGNVAAVSNQPRNTASIYDNTGFMPMRPSYENPQLQNPQQLEGGYGSLNGALAPSNAKETKARRRESGVMLMNMGLSASKPAGRKGSLPQLKEMDPRMAKDERDIYE